MTDEELRAAIAEHSAVPAEAITPDANLVQLGISSLEIMRLVTRWRRDGLAVSFETLVAAPTLGAWAAHFEEIETRAER
ncbi:phosphopantetheine-binding protein [Amycolatopsis sp. EV170708-02-1]|uniref:phosphopantetheine-binding protein n=1 Tax=Amycolatopsis sp. EV170708-02-1 TaxID=2919322 RepID=UPI001F0B7339|nr:phosphopantetheine-binding protein [Amycolatopsis sp. EV170708-02-1]UMP01317.1 phosphopantetheine-binding protein [Amycolatopsis sp. EV170708-02-1]